MEYEFSDLQQQILEAVQELDRNNFFGQGTQVTIVPGFIMAPIQQTIGSDIELGSSLPMVAVVDNNTGQVWQFALTKLIPHVRIS